MLSRLHRHYGIAAVTRGQFEIGAIGEKRNIVPHHVGRDSPWSIVTTAVGHFPAKAWGEEAIAGPVSEM